jgi:hypothetical protein
MDRKIVLGAGALALALGGSVAAGVAGATPAPPATLSGLMKCSLTGAYHFAPYGLTNSAGQQTAVTLRGTLRNCVGAGATNGVVSIVLGHLLATSASTVSNSWPGLTTGGGESFPTLSGTIVWKASHGRVTTTNVTVAGPSQSIEDNSGTNLATVFVTPTLTAGGSYAGQTVATTGLTYNANAFSLGVHAASSSGVKSIPFGATGGFNSANGGTITIEAGA